MSVITCIEDLRRLHRKRAPRAFYDYVDAGSYSEITYRANSADLAALQQGPWRDVVAAYEESRALLTTPGAVMAMPVGIRIR